MGYAFIGFLKDFFLTSEKLKTVDLKWIALFIPVAIVSMVICPIFLVFT